MNLKALPSLFGFRRSAPVESAEASRLRSDAEAFVHRAHEAHGDFVFRTLQRFGVRDADLEDMTQEVFMIVLRKWTAYEPDVKMTTWLYGIAMRVAAGQRRRAWVRREEPTGELPHEATNESPESALVAARRARALDEVLGALDVDARAIFVMFEIEGLGAQEIGDLAGIPVGTVYSRLHYARKKFEHAAELRRRREERGAP